MYCIARERSHTIASSWCINMPFDGTPIALFDQRKCNNGLPAIGEGAQAGSYAIVEKSKNRFWACSYY